VTDYSAPASPPERSTLSDVAALAGVSAKTASRALNGHPGVSADARERVEQAAIKLRFRPNGLAKELRSGGKSNAVGLIVADISNPYFSRLAAAVEVATQARGLELIIGSTGEDAQRERDLVRSFVERRAQALLVVPASDNHRYLQFEASIGTPLVFVDRPPIDLAVDVVIGDDHEAARSAIESLVGAGHERIAVLADYPQAWTARERLNGVREALRAHGRAESGVLVHEGAHTPALAAAAMRGLLALPQPPTAVLALNNLSTLGALRTLRESGTPLSLVGFDDSDAAELLDVSVVATDPEAMGRRAAEIALARMDGDQDAAATEVIPTKLIVRTPLDQPLSLARRA
jgi:LacI family transcriptional regulator